MPQTMNSRNRLIGVVVGSLRHGSFNHKLAQVVMRLAPAHFQFAQLAIASLPLYNQDEDDHQSPNVLHLKEQIRSCDGLLFVTPEYNRSMPGVLKNALDHASRPYGQNAWDAKPAGMLGASPGATGTAMAQQHLRNVLAYLNVPTMAQPEAYIQVKPDFFDAQDQVSASTSAFLQNWMDHYVAWVERCLA